MSQTQESAVTPRQGEDESSQVAFMSGNEACAEAALMAGCRFFAGYPITPSTEIAEVMAARLPQLGGRFIQMEDEIASMGAIIGASVAGVKAMTATSGPGFSLKQENLGFASLCEIPTVIVDVQRVGPSTGLPTSPSQADVQQARWGSHGDHPVVALSPSSVDETFRVTIEAFNIAEELMVPVVILLDEVIGHMREKVVIPHPSSLRLVERRRPQVPPEEYLPYATDETEIPILAPFGTGYRYHITGLFHDKTGFPTGDPEECDYLVRRLMRKIDKHKDRLMWVIEESAEDAEVLVVSFGASARPAVSAVRQARAQGIKAGMVKVVTIWPFPYEMFTRLAAQVRGIIVPEMNLGQLALEVERAAMGQARVHKIGKVDGTFFHPDEILSLIREV